MGGVLEYMAMIRLLDLVESGNYDLVVLDTPPAYNAIDFLEAPEKIEGLLENQPLNGCHLKKRLEGNFCIGCRGSGVRGLQTFLGSQMIEEIGTFFEHFTPIGSAMHQRAMTCKELLISPQTQCFLVTSPNRPTADVEGFYTYLNDNDYSIGGFIANRCRSFPSQSIHLNNEQTLSQSHKDVFKWAGFETINFEHQQTTKQINALKQMSKVWVAPEYDTKLKGLDDLISLSQHMPTQ